MLLLQPHVGEVQAVQEVDLPRGRNVHRRFDAFKQRLYHFVWAACTIDVLEYYV